MERDLLLAVLAPLVCGPLLLVPWRFAPEPRTDVPPAQAEQRAWRAIALGLLPAACALAALVGWALVEPDPSDEWVAFGRVVAAVLLAVPWLRAGCRAALALTRHPPVTSAATVGLCRPRVVVAEAFERAVDGDVLRAAVAHEDAHVANRDPLRLWLAQLGTDLQWPAPHASRRFERWRAALE